MGARLNTVHPQAHISDPSNELNRLTPNKLRVLLLRKIWLPKSLYTVLPLLYIGLGLYAIVAALLLGQWSWVIPYMLILGIVLLPAGAIIMAMRWRNRNGSPGPPGTQRS